MGSTGGWNRPSANQPMAKKGGAKAPSKVKGIVAGLVTVCALGGLCLWMFSGGEDAPKAKAEKERGRIKTVTPATVPTNKDRVKKRVAKPKTVEEVVANLDAEPKPEIERVELSPEDWRRITNRVFQTGIEQLMARVFTTTPGDLPMPIPRVSDEEKRDIAAILITRTEIKDTDCESMRFCKEQVNLAKKEMAKFIGDGGNPDDFLMYYRRELLHEYRMRSDAVDQIREVGYEDPDLAEEMRQEVNKALESRGIRTIIEGEIR